MSNAALKQQPQEEPPTASDLAQRAMAQAGDDVGEAARILEQWARKNTRVWKAVTEDFLAQGCYSVVRGVCRQERRAIWHSPGYDKGGAGSRVRNHARSILDLPLPGGKRLRDATRDDLHQASEFYSRQARQMAVMEEFLASVAAKIKGRKTVGDVLSEKQLETMKPHGVNGEAA